MEPNTAFRRADNDGPSRLAGFAIGCGVGSEPSWAALAVSRATVRSALVNFAAALNYRPNEFNIAITERGRCTRALAATHLPPAAAIRRRSLERNLFRLKRAVKGLDRRRRRAP